MKRDIEMVMLKLTEGERIIRFSDPASGLCLEKKLDADDSVLHQQGRWRQVFESMIERELGVVG